MGVQAPEGFRPFSWWTSTGTRTQVRQSKVHLVGGDDPKARTTLCRRQPPRDARREQHWPNEAELHERGVCERCFQLALREHEHRLHVGRRRVLGSQPVTGNVYGTNGSCSCGKVWRNSTKREIEQDHREHVKSVIDDGEFRIQHRFAHAGYSVLRERCDVYTVSMEVGASDFSELRRQLDIEPGETVRIQGGYRRADASFRVTRLRPGLKQSEAI